MYQFQCDYICGCHPAVLEALSRTNLTEVPGYGDDEFTASASKKILEACALPDASVFFLSGGTQTNLCVASAVLRSHQGMCTCDTGHIEAHETGAIEGTGHKVLTIPNDNGRLTADALDAYCSSYRDNEEKVLLVQPGLVYISFPTETGSIYTLAELEALRRVCDKHELLLYIDGARLAYGLAASPDVKITDIARLADLFYIGGTKCGTLAGEALVIKDKKLAKIFPAVSRRHGALLAKGRFAGVQFDALFTDDLYFKIGEKAVAQAMQMRKAFIEAGVVPDGDSPTNQQFVRLNDAQYAFMSRDFRFEKCCVNADGTTTVRFCSAWSTTDEAFEKLMAAIPQLKGLK